PSPPMPTKEHRMPFPLWILPLITGGLLLAVFGWRREMTRRGQRATEAAELPAGAVPLATPSSMAPLRSQLIGALMLVAVGTYGLKQTQRLLVLLHACHLDALVGSILIVENDAQSRADFHTRLPAVYHDRVVYGFSE